MAKKKAGRRGNNEGSIYQRQDGRWCGQVHLGYDEHGKPKRKFFLGKTREEVARKVAEATNSVFRGTSNYDAARISTGDYITEWALNFKRPEVTARTFGWYMDNINRYIVPSVGSVPLQKLTAFHIQSVLQEMSNKGMGIRMIKGVRLTFGQAMKHAVVTHILPHDPMLGVVAPKSKQKVGEEKVKAIPIEIRTQLLAAIEADEHMKPLLMTMMFSGMRTQEILALTWGNVNLGARTVTIDRAVTLEPTFNSDGQKLGQQSIISTPKTASSYRDIVVPQSIADVLTEWRDRRSAQDARYTAADAPVFVGIKGGNRYTYDSFYSAFRAFLKRSGFAEHDITPHMFRHTFATILLENEVNPRVAQGILGHSDVSTTLNIYSHVARKVYENVAETMGDVYSALQDGTYEPKAGKG